MGKYIILATFAVAMSVTLVSRQGMQSDLETSESQALRQKQVLARQIARSAFEMGMAELRRDFENWRVQREEVPHEGGSFDLTASGPSGGPVTLSVVGRHGEATYEITGQAKRQNKASALFNGITAGGSVDFDVSGPGCSGGPCVSGLDPSGGEARRGISLPSSTSNQDREDVCDEFGGKVEGRGEDCDVVSRSQAQEDWIDREMQNLESRIQDMIDQGSNDVTVCGNGQGNGNGNGKGNGKGNGNGGGTSSTCRLNGNQSASGILYVKGEFQFNGQAQWNGPVYVADGGSIRINGGGGTRNVNGGVVMEENTELDMNGGNRIQYNSEKILDLQSTMPSLGVETVQMTNRTGQLNGFSSE